MALDMVAAHASYVGEPHRASAAAREERAIAERLGDPYHLAMAVMRQCWSAGHLRESRAFADEALPLLRRCGNLRGIVEMAPGVVGPALMEGDYEAAADAADEGLRAAEELGEPLALAWGIGNAGLAALFLERMDAAERLFRRQLEILRRERIDLFSDESALGLACIAAHGDDVERAATLLGFGESVPGPPLSYGDRQLRDQLIAKFIAPARAGFTEHAWKRAADAGAAMTLDELCEFALDRRAADTQGLV